MQAHEYPRKIALVGNYLPRRCGIATFTYDLAHALRSQYPRADYLVVPVNDVHEGYQYPEEVRFEIYQEAIDDYRKAADFLTFADCDVISLQHEYGIFGGKAGRHVLAFLHAVRIPVVTTLHTVLRDPTPNQRSVMEELAALSTRLVVMSGRGAGMLRDVYGVPERKIEVIPHGIPDMPFVDPNFYKDQFGVEGKHVLLTFGLLSPNKGIENVLRALPRVLEEFPDCVYIVLGATHPNLLKTEGETYRLSLERLAADLGVEKNVIFYNRFVDAKELKEFLGCADIYITPYLNPAQVTSGTLSFAFGCGKAVISTPYWHAEELLAEDRGILVPFRDPDAVAEAVLALLRDEPRRHAMRKRAYLVGRDMVWSNIAHMYMKTFIQARRDMRRGRPQVIKTLDKRRKGLPEIRLDHLWRLTDSTGIFQHARFSFPNFAEGYCTDDNARAFMLTVRLEEVGVATEEVYRLAVRYAAFVNNAFNPERKRFRNFMTFDRRWEEDVGSEDCHGRAVWALGTCIGRSKRQDFKMWAAQLFEEALPEVLRMRSPRAWAFTLLGIGEYAEKLSGVRQVNQVREELLGRLIDSYRRTASEEWKWFEDVVSYDNAVLPHALLAAHGGNGAEDDAVRIGLEALRWLVDLQMVDGGHFRPVGTEGYRRGETRSCYDQQPLEAWAACSACITAFRLTDDPFWSRAAGRIFEWFLGRNDVGIALYNPITRGCHDGLHVDRVNQNQGAESTLAFLLALTEMHLFQNMLVAREEEKKESLPA